MKIQDWVFLLAFLSHFYVKLLKCAINMLDFSGYYTDTLPSLTKHTL